jgi:hypothetical protein
LSYLRFTLDLAIKQPLPQVLQNKIPLIKEKILELKNYAEKINTGINNEENSVRAVYHICRHDEGLPCGEEKEI